MNGLDPQAWLADILDRIHDHKINRLDELLPCSCGRLPTASQRARMSLLKFSIKGGHPWNKLFELEWIRQRRVFQLHGVNAAEQPILRMKLSRRAMVKFFEKAAPTTIAIEACGGSHHWSGLHHHQNGQPSSPSRDAPSPFQLAEKGTVSDHIESTSPDCPRP